MNNLWRKILVGGVDRTTQLPVGPSRQWAEIIRSLDAMRTKAKDGRLTTFAYNQLRDDIHPKTRRELLLQFLQDIPEFTPEMLASAKRNIQKDSGRVLSYCTSTTEASELTHAIWSSLEASFDKFGQNEVVNWWADVLYSVEEPSDWLKSGLEHEMRARVNHSNQLIQLSAIFGLAKIPVTDIVFIVDMAMMARPEWSSNEMLINWLEELKKGKTSYPDRSMLDPPNTLQ
jgi:hypothetical protein